VQLSSLPGFGRLEIGGCIKSSFDMRAANSQNPASPF
jgi:hypothetical protein